MKNRIRIRIRKTFIRIHNTDFLKELKKLFCFLTNISALGRVIAFLLVQF
jgi:hypothetical protein